MCLLESFQQKKLNMYAGFIRIIIATSPFGFEVWGNTGQSQSPNKCLLVNQTTLLTFCVQYEKWQIHATTKKKNHFFFCGVGDSAPVTPVAGDIHLSLESQSHCTLYSTDLHSYTCQCGRPETQAHANFLAFQSSSLVKFARSAWPLSRIKRMKALKICRTAE